MSGPADGRYYIQLATDRQPRIGVDNVGAPVAPVITDGWNNVVSPSVFFQRSLRSYPFISRGSLCLPFLYDGMMTDWSLALLQWTVKKLGNPEPSGIPYSLVIEGTGPPVFIHVDDDGNLFGDHNTSIDLVPRWR